MATFQVPQFIDQKAKIIGPLNMLQFGYLGGAGLIIFGTFYVFAIPVWILISLPVAGIALFLAFAKVNGQESHKLIQSLFGFLFGSKIYVWKREVVQEKIALHEPSKAEAARQKMNFSDKIKSIALEVSTGKLFKEEKKPRDTEAPLSSGPGFEVATFETGEKKLVKRVDY